MLGLDRSRNRLQEIGRSFHWGYFFESISHVLKKAESGETLTHSEKKILKKANEFLNNVKSGKNNVENGTLSYSAIDTIGAYKQSLFVFSMINKSKIDKFDEFISGMIKQIDNINKDNYNTTEIKKIANFFNELNKKNLRDTERAIERLHPERGPIEWIVSS